MSITNCVNSLTLEWRRHYVRIFYFESDSTRRLPGLSLLSQTLSLNGSHCCQLFAPCPIPESRNVYVCCCSLYFKSKSRRLHVLPRGRIPESRKVTALHSSSKYVSQRCCTHTLFRIRWLGQVTKTPVLTNCVVCCMSGYDLCSLLTSLNTLYRLIEQIVAAAASVHRGLSLSMSHP